MCRVHALPVCAGPSTLIWDRMDDLVFPLARGGMFSLLNENFQFLSGKVVFVKKRVIQGFMRWTDTATTLLRASSRTRTRNLLATTGGKQRNLRYRQVERVRWPDMCPRV